MPGGQPDAYDLIAPIFNAIAAKVDGEPCSTYIGADGAGHYVKMVHNGIEYGDMQLITEAYFLLKEILGLTAAELHEVFSDWNKGELDSYLIEITADIFTKRIRTLANPSSTSSKTQPGRKALASGPARTPSIWALQPDDR
jgi:6-phosphogluconate dehydrogenase